jgi:hypothetical protein
MKYEKYEVKLIYGDVNFQNKLVYIRAIDGKNSRHFGLHGMSPLTITIGQNSITLKQPCVGYELDNPETRRLIQFFKEHGKFKLIN